jgi:hypothetical protein
MNDEEKKEKKVFFLQLRQSEKELFMCLAIFGELSELIEFFLTYLKKKKFNAIWIQN